MYCRRKRKFGKNWRRIDDYEAYKPLHDILVDMTRALKELIDRAASWPQEVQEEAAETLRAIERGHIGAYKLTPEDKAALAQSEKDVRNKKFASPKKVADFFKRARA